MRPDSSGSRSASSDARANSGSSSRNSTPWCASETSPGRGGEPPPTSATDDALWCGRETCAVASRPALKSPFRLSTAADRGFVLGQRRQKATLREHRLSGAGRADHQRCARRPRRSRARVWPRPDPSRRSVGDRPGCAGRRRPRATRHAASPGRRSARRRAGGRRRGSSGRRPAPPPRHSRRAAPGRARAAALQRQGERQRAADGRSSPARLSSPANSNASSCRRVDLPVRRQDAERDRQVEAP